MRLLLFFTLLSFTSYGQTYHLFIGTYTDSGSKGIYVYRFNAATGKASWVSNTDSVSNPSFLAMSADKKFLYAVNETGGKQSGKVSAFSFDKMTGRLQFINQQESGGDHPCYVAVDKGNRWVFASNYNGGNVAALGVRADGSLAPYAQLIQNSGSSIVKPNQDKAHVHGTFLSPKQDFVYVTDLGIDKIMAYKFDPEATLPLTSSEPPFVQTHAGSGPRHMSFHPNNKFAYAIEELSGTVAAYKYNKGNLLPIQRLSSHRANYIGKTSSADIHISPDGNFLYASNRGDANTLTIFSINKKTGRLKLTGYQATNGKTPRNFAIDPTGNYLLVANLETNNIVVFKRNKKTGALTATGEEIKVPKPVCLLIR